MKKNRRNKKPIIKIRLPKLKRETVISLGVSLEHGVDDNFFTSTLNEIAFDDPILAEVIEGQATQVAELWESGRTKEALAWAMNSGHVVYKLLKSQAEADEMNENFR